MQIRVWRPGACRYVDLLSYFFPYTVWLIKKIIKIIWICVFVFFVVVSFSFLFPRTRTPCENWKCQKINKQLTDNKWINGLLVSAGRSVLIRRLDGEAQLHFLILLFNVSLCVCVCNSGRICWKENGHNNNKKKKTTTTTFDMARILSIDNQQTKCVSFRRGSARGWKFGPLTQLIALVREVRKEEEEESNRLQRGTWSNLTVWMETGGVWRNWRDVRKNKK
jgi:hypothetical protein